MTSRTSLWLVLVAFAAPNIAVAQDDDKAQARKDEEAKLEADMDRAEAHIHGETVPEPPAADELEGPSGVERYKNREAELDRRIKEARQEIDSHAPGHGEPGTSGVDRYKAIDRARAKELERLRKKIQKKAERARRKAGPVEDKSGVNRYRQHHDVFDDEFQEYWQLRAKYLEAKALERHGNEPQNRAHKNRSRIGLEAHLAFGPAAGDGVEAIWVPGLIFAYTFTSFLTAGIGQIAPGATELVSGTRWAMTGAPFVEGFGFLTDWLQVYGQLGVPVQIRFGAALRSAVGVAPYVGGGARFWVGSLFSVGPDVRLFWVATDGFMMPTQVLPRNSMVLTFGFNLGMNL